MYTNEACYFYKVAQERAISAVGNTCIIVLRIYLGVTFQKMIKIGRHLTKLNQFIRDTSNTVQFFGPPCSSRTLVCYLAIDIPNTK